jgi:hypothetical protein
LRLDLITVWPTLEVEYIKEGLGALTADRVTEKMVNLLGIAISRKFPMNDQETKEDKRRRPGAESE